MVSQAVRATISAKWIVLVVVILIELIATMALRASIGNAEWIPVAVVGYVAAFVGLGMTLRLGMPVGVAYGIWGGAGVALTAVFGALIFNETLSGTGKFGLALIIVGVVLIEMSPEPHDDAAADGVPA
ncbi:QacE family quaternary ammonium compound efflux SMR transporter [Gordonia sp. TBRC 11910]|uniref:QacE family quaternary ammonium compound efflux SMR transporter n=1 Tax=Gordonia asplenii TaxID=2725283 RepID=A0A848L3L8_9ACTN|nr:SMR family transporter [Gordonia asplenii]NMO02238.1 QacE family quaternary ammonium compound efflux SMR transporter [Gordonia asplenii]